MIFVSKFQYNIEKKEDSDEEDDEDDDDAFSNKKSNVPEDPMARKLKNIW